MDYKVIAFASVMGILVSAKLGDCVRVNFEPNIVTVGGPDSSQPGTQQDLVIECTTDGTNNVGGVFSFYLKRVTSTIVEMIAEIDTFSNNAKISDDAPSDIRNRISQVEGRVGSGDSYLRVRIPISELTCQDETRYTCEMNYKPSNGITDKVTDERSLTMTFLPGNLELTASRLVNGFPQILMNQSIVQYNDQLEYRCAASIGKNSATILEWHRQDHVTGMFGRFFPTSSIDTIDDGQVSTGVCPYTRTSVLRYRVTTADRQLIVFRCQVPSAPSQTVASQHFSVTPPVIGGTIGGASMPGSSHVLLLLAAVCGLLYRFIVT